MGDDDRAPEREGRTGVGDGVEDEGGVSERGGRAGAGDGVGDDGGVSERGGGAGEFAGSSPGPLRHLKHLVGMLLSSQSATFFRYHSFSPESRCMIAFAPRFRQYLEMGGPLVRISEEGEMATRCDDVKRTCCRCKLQRLKKRSCCRVQRGL